MGDQRMQQNYIDEMKLKTLHEIQKHTKEMTNLDYCKHRTSIFFQAYYKASSQKTFHVMFANFKTKTLNCDH